MSSIEKLKISDFCKTGSGGPPSRSNTAFFQNGTIPWVKSGELKNRFVTAVEEYITEEAVKKSSAKIVPKNSLLLAMYGATVGEVSQLLFDATTNQAICNIFPDPEICDVNYLYRYLQFSKPLFLNRRVGGGQPNISQGVIRDLEVPLPPLPEQKRIAEILDKAEELRQKRQQSIEKLDELLQATFIDMFGDPVSNSKNHKKAKLIDILQKLTDGTHHSPVNVEVGVPYITAKHIKEGFIDFFSKPTYISLADHKSIYSRCDSIKGDVLYIKDGATTGIAAINNFDFEFSLLSSVALLRPNKDLITSEYLESWLNHSIVKKNIISNMGGAAIKRLTLAKIKELEILLPDIASQRKFTGVKKQIEQQKQTLLKQLNEKETLFQSLQQRAFNGEL